MAESQPSYRVTIGLLEGKERECWLNSFTPYGLRLNTKVAPESEDSQQIMTDRVAFVAFFKSETDQSTAGKSKKVELRIHVPGNKSFRVAAAEGTTEKNVGFYGTPLDDDSPYAKIFFYPQGVVRIETLERLGDILVKEGFIEKKDLTKTVEVQSAQRDIPLGQILVQQAKLSDSDVRQAAEIQKQKRRKLRIGEVLVQEGLITEADVEKALQEQKKKRGKRLGEILLDLKLIEEELLFQTLAKKFHMPYINLDETVLNEEAASAVSQELKDKYGCLPVDSNDTTMVVAISDPLNTDLYDVLRFKVGKEIVEVVAMPSQIHRYLKQGEQALAGQEALLEELQEDVELELEETAEEAERDVVVAAESDSTVVKLANKIILDAFQRGASDIHIEPYGAKKNAVIRIRIDGKCETYKRIPPKYWRTLVTRYKIMSKLDIAERRKPQDGKIRLQGKGRTIELRVATIPTVNGIEDVVLRILASSKPVPIEKMHLSARNLREFQQLIHQPYGLFLCVGPTGSGKTTTLHSALNVINTVDRKIWTAEDPVEITQEQMRQVQVHPKIGFTFAAAMRSFLRADPDVIMIGEMRDEETASIAVEASLTGHMVASTLHTNSAPETITRLLNMGLDPFTFADALLGVLAQRLARRICTHCREMYEPNQKEIDEILTILPEERIFEICQISDLSDLWLWKATGCQLCANTGYKGRIALHELLVTNEEIKQAIENRAPVGKIRDMARQGGMTTLMEDGVEKTLLGHTNLTQVRAVCH